MPKSQLLRHFEYAMTAPAQTKTFAASIDSLPAIMGWIENLLSGTKAPIPQIQLALEEAVVNVINHAYKDKGGELILSCLVLDNEVEFILRDQGFPFNPLTAEHFIDTTTSLQARQEGGLGLMLMKKFMTSLEYERKGEENILTLRRKFT